MPFGMATTKQEATPFYTVKDQKAFVQRLMDFQSFEEALDFVTAVPPSFLLPARQIQELLAKMPDRVNSLRVFNLVCMKGFGAEDYPAYLTGLLADKMERVLVEVAPLEGPTCSNYLRGQVVERFFQQLHLAYDGGVMVPLVLNALNELLSRVDCASDEVKHHLHEMGLCVSADAECMTC